MGLIEARHGSGNVVRDPEGLTHPAVVEALVRKLGPEFLVELLEIRAALGPLIGRLAAQRRVPQDTDALRAFNEKFLHYEQLEATVLPVGDGFGIGVVRRTA